MFYECFYITCMLHSKHESAPTKHRGENVAQIEREVNGSRQIFKIFDQSVNRANFS